MENCQTCIVCLGDLPLEDPSDAKGCRSPGRVYLTLGDFDDIVIARLPCSHMLHDTCLKPWTDRANSCPVCRQNFNQVDLCLSLTGDPISSYSVEDRVQRPLEDGDVPPIDELEDDDYAEHLSTCFICELDDNENVLLICDACDSTYHTYCLGLDSVPPGGWYCPPCVSDREFVHLDDDLSTALGSTVRSRGRTRTTAGSSSFRSGRGTRFARQRPGTSSRSSTRSSATAQQQHWSEVWQSVILPELEAQEEEEDDDIPREVDAEQTRRELEERELWRRRVEIARQSGSDLLQRNAPWILDRSARNRPEEPAVETEEEKDAWAMFAKAEKIEADEVAAAAASSATVAATTASASSEGPSSRTRAKSRSATPVVRDAAADSVPEATASSRRKLKRPMTRRDAPPPPSERETKRRRVEATDTSSVSSNNNNNAGSDHAGSEGGSDAGSPPVTRNSIAMPKRSMLDCLLDDIDRSTSHTLAAAPNMSSISESPPAPNFETSLISPRPSRPSSAGAVSDESMEDAAGRLSPSYHHHHHHHHRHLAAVQSSPTQQQQQQQQQQLQSPRPRRVPAIRMNRPFPGGPLFPDQLSPNMLSPPASSPPPPQPPSSTATTATTNVNPSSYPTPPLAPTHPIDRAGSASPPNLSLGVKSEIEGMVRHALVPHYSRSGGISKEQFADVNKAVSRKIYGMVGDISRIKEWDKSKWRDVARSEVEMHVGRLEK